MFHHSCLHRPDANWGLLLCILLVSCSDNFISSTWWQTNLFRVSSRSSSPINNNRVPFSNLKCLSLISSRNFYQIFNSLCFRIIHSSHSLHSIHSSRLFILTLDNTWLYITRSNQIYHPTVSNQVPTHHYRQVSFCRTPPVTGNFAFNFYIFTMRYNVYLMA